VNKTELPAACQRYSTTKFLNGDLPPLLALAVIVSTQEIIEAARIRAEEEAKAVAEAARIQEEEAKATAAAASTNSEQDSRAARQPRTVSSDQEEKIEERKTKEVRMLVKSAWRNLLKFNRQRTFRELAFVYKSSNLINDYIVYSY